MNVRIRRRGRGRARGLAMIETALVSPFLVLLLVGGVQVGQIAYSSISLDTAVREGARAGVAAPNAALESGGTTWYSQLSASHYCTASDFSAGATGNPVCTAAMNAAGFLSSSSFTSNPCASGQACITITVVPPAGLSRLVVPAPQMRLAGFSPCNSGQQAEIDGSVNGMPSGSGATVTDTSGDKQTGITSTFVLCAAAHGNVTGQTLTAQVGSPSCGGYSGTLGPISVQHGQVITGQTITVTAEQACPTPTPTPTATPTPTPTPTPVATPTPAAGPGTTCPAETVPDSYYMTVSVNYPVPVFVPFIGGLFQTQPGIRMISSSATFAIEPCTMTQGA